MVCVRNDEGRFDCKGVLMGWPTYTHPPLPPARPAIDLGKLERLKMAGELAHATLEELPKEIAREYSQQLSQLQSLIEKLNKEGNK